MVFYFSRHFQCKIEEITFKPLASVGKQNGIAPIISVII